MPDLMTVTTRRGDDFVGEICGGTIDLDGRRFLATEVTEFHGPRKDDTRVHDGHVYLRDGSRLAVYFTGVIFQKPGISGKLELRVDSLGSTLSLDIKSILKVSPRLPDRE